MMIMYMTVFVFHLLNQNKFCFLHSRFGKYLEVGFDASHSVVGAYMRTFLLESVLVCQQSPDESNFHVFYQLVRGTFTSYLIVYYSYYCIIRYL